MVRPWDSIVVNGIIMNGISLKEPARAFLPFCLPPWDDTVFTPLQAEYTTRRNHLGHGLFEYLDLEFQNCKKINLYSL